MRRHAGLNVTEFGRRCGLKQTYISNIEAERRQPSFAAMHAMAEVLGIDDLRAILHDVLKDPVPVIADLSQTESAA
jgi:transcriptional regulator with XRE-family HTH domain